MEEKTVAQIEAHLASLWSQAERFLGLAAQHAAAGNLLIAAKLTDVASDIHADIRAPSLRIFPSGRPPNGVAMSTPPAHGTEYWRRRAEEARRQAAELTDPKAKQALGRIADIYEKLAEEAERSTNRRSNN